MFKIFFRNEARFCALEAHAERSRLNDNLLDERLKSLQIRVEALEKAKSEKQKKKSKKSKR